NQRPSGIGDDICLARQWPRDTLQSEDWQISDVEHRIVIVRSPICDPDVHPQFSGMITYVGRIMKVRAEPGKICNPYRVVESSHACDIDVNGIEYFLATRHRSSILVPLVGSANVVPSIVRIEDK